MVEVYSGISGVIYTKYIHVLGSGLYWLYMKLGSID